MRYHHVLCGALVLNDVGLYMVHMHNTIPNGFSVDSLLLVYKSFSLI